MSPSPARAPVPKPVDLTTTASWPAYRAEVAAHLAPALGTAPRGRGP